MEAASLAPVSKDFNQSARQWIDSLKTAPEGKACDCCSTEKGRIVVFDEGAENLSATCYCEPCAALSHGWDQGELGAWPRLTSMGTELSTKVH
jgi:hypothetical protein